ncbi:MAG: hypothetical protein NT091_02545, partial [Candidatus Falkowbacteria bacterium]|nr:hypothetical protein [Candidatus Falkowbacteria bacterium]
MNFEDPLKNKKPNESEVINRKKAWDKDLELDLVSVGMSVAREDANNYLDDIKRHIGNKENYLGEGGVGIVFRLGSESGICIKIIANRHESSNANIMNLGNDVDQEVKFLLDLESLEVDGVSATRCLAYFRGRDYNAIVMEELNAVNLRDVLAGIAKIPSHFNLNKSFAALEDYINNMQVKRGIVHNDLEARNLMIDSSGCFRVIDYGRAFYER